MTPVDVVSSFERHIQVEVRLGLSTMVVAREKAMQPMLTRLRSLKPSMDEATAVLAHLGEDACLFSPEERQSIGAVAQATMVESATSTARATAKTQQHLCLHRYLPQRLWSFLESDDSMENKFRQLAQFMCQCLGLRNPDAKTKRLAVVLVHLASKSSPTPKAAYESVQRFSDIMEQKRSSVCTQQSLFTFPDDPQVFMDAYPDAYGPEDPPIACRVSETSIVERCRKGVTPCRNTNLQVREQVTKPSQASSPSNTPNAGDSVNGALLALLEKFMMQRGNTSLSDTLASHRAFSPHSPRAIAQRSLGESIVGSSPSSAGSPAPEQFFSGGILPNCLDPCHDKLAQLKAKLGCAGEPHDPLPLSDTLPEDAQVDEGSALPRLSTKRAREPSCKEEPEESGVEGRVAPVLKKPSATPRPPRKSAKPAAASVHEALLKRPAKVDRPPQSERPTAHAGGKIYWSKPKSAYRVYLRVGDRIEKRVPANSGSKDDMRQKFLICCALIENDKRPVRAS